MPLKTASKILDYARAWPLGVLGFVLLAYVVLTDLARFDLLFWGVTKVSVMAYLGYWIDRLIFPYARPHDWWWAHPARPIPPGDEPDMEERWAVKIQVVTPIPQIRRAIIIAAAMLVAALIP